jgi:hypothetical protein
MFFLAALTVGPGLRVLRLRIVARHLALPFPFGGAGPSSWVSVSSVRHVGSSVLVELDTAISCNPRARVPGRRREEARVRRPAREKTCAGSAASRRSGGRNYANLSQNLQARDGRRHGNASAIRASMAGFLSIAEIS